MSSRRTLILVAAVLVGALAAFALFTYVGGIEDRAHDRAERVEVFRIAQDIPKGTFGDQAFDDGMIVQDTIQKAYRPANAITSRGQIDGLVAISDLAANQVVVTNQFVSQAQSLSGYSPLLRNDEVAITISVDEVRGVAGLLVPGDFVNLLVTVEDADPGATAQAEAAANPGQEVVVYANPARHLYQKVQILAVDRQVRLQPGETVDGDGDTPTTVNAGLITLAVPPEAAQRIASVEGSGIYLTLVARDYQPEPLGPIDPTEALPGELGDQLTPYGPDGRLDS